MTRRYAATSGHNSTMFVACGAETGAYGSRIISLTRSPSSDRREGSSQRLGGEVPVA
jgi:hypothetical protein